MSRFTGPLKLEELVPGKRWRILDTVRYEVGRKGSGFFIEVPAGFETDGASIPPALRLVLAVWGTYGRAALLHDWLYGLIRQGVFNSVIPRSGMTPREARRWADREFRIAALALGTSPWLAWFMWAGVRVGGGRYLQRQQGGA